MNKILVKQEKKFVFKFMIHIAVFLIILALSVVLNETNELSLYSTGFLAMSPVVPIIFLLRMIVSHYRSLDEYIQRVMGESLLWAVGVVGCSAMSYGLLAQMVEVPSFSPAFMLPAIAFIFGIAQYIQLGNNNHEE